MKHGLPEIGDAPRRLPVAAVRPDLNQIAILPGEAILTPDLTRVGAWVEGPALELHENIIAIHQRNLVMNQKVARIGSLGSDQGVIHKIGQYLIEVLSGV